MRKSIRVFIAASVTVAGLGIAGCQSEVPQRDAPGGVLSGNDFQRTRATRSSSALTGGTTDAHVAGQTQGSYPAAGPAGGGTAPGSSTAAGAAGGAAGGASGVGAGGAGGAGGA